MNPPSDPVTVTQTYTLEEWEEVVIQAAAWKGAAIAFMIAFILGFLTGIMTLGYSLYWRF